MPSVSPLPPDLPRWGFESLDPDRPGRCVVPAASLPDARDAARAKLGLYLDDQLKLVLRTLPAN